MSRIDTLTEACSKSVAEARLEVLAGAVLDVLSVLDLQARVWLTDKHPEIRDALSTVEDVLREFHLEHADDGAWYRAWVDMQNKGTI